MGTSFTFEVDEILRVGGVELLQSTMLAASAGWWGFLWSGFTDGKSKRGPMIKCSGHMVPRISGMSFVSEERILQFLPDIADEHEVRTTLPFR